MIGNLTFYFEALKKLKVPKNGKGKGWPNKRTFQKLNKLYESKHCLTLTNPFDERGVLKKSWDNEVNLKFLLLVFPMRRRRRGLAENQFEESS